MPFSIYHPRGVEGTLPDARPLSVLSGFSGRALIALSLSVGDHQHLNTLTVAPGEPQQITVGPCVVAVQLGHMSRGSLSLTRVAGAETVTFRVLPFCF